MASFIDRVQLPQGCRATAGDSLLLITKSPGALDTHFHAFMRALGRLITRLKIISNFLIFKNYPEIPGNILFFYSFCISLS